MLELLQSRTIREHTEKALHHVVEQEQKRVLAHYGNAVIHAKRQLFELLQVAGLLSEPLEEIKKRVYLHYVNGDPLHYIVRIDNIEVGVINLHLPEMGLDSDIPDAISKETELEQQLVKVDGK